MAVESLCSIFDRELFSYSLEESASNDGDVDVYFRHYAATVVFEDFDKDFNTIIYQLKSSEELRQLGLMEAMISVLLALKKNEGGEILGTVHRLCINYGDACAVVLENLTPPTSKQTIDLLIEPHPTFTAQPCIWIGAVATLILAFVTTVYTFM